MTLLEVPEDRDGGTVERNEAISAVFSYGQVDEAPVQIDLVPRCGELLGLAHPGVQGDIELGEGTLALVLDPARQSGGDGFPELGLFLIGQKPDPTKDSFERRISRAGFTVILPALMPSRNTVLREDLNRFRVPPVHSLSSAISSTQSCSSRVVMDSATLSPNSSTARFTRCLKSFEAR